MNRNLPLAAFFDLDGTLALDNQPPAAADVAAIRAFRAAGNFVFLCTGRSPGYLYDAVTRIGFDGIVAGAGAHVTVGDRLLYRNGVSQSQLQPILRAFTGTPHTLVMETEEGMVQLASAPDAQIVRDYPVITCSEQWNERYGDWHVTKLTVYRTPLGEELKAVLAKELDFICHPTYHEAVPRGCSKSDGMRRVLEVIGVPRENSIAFGDSPNDADMIRFAGLGVVMGDGVPAVQAIADRVTLPLADCGVAHVLKEFI